MKTIQGGREGRTSCHKDNDYYNNFLPSSSAPTEIVQLCPKTTLQQKMSQAKSSIEPFIKGGPYAEFEAPDRVFANVSKGLLEENENSHNGESHPHFSRKHDFAWIFAAHLVGFGPNSLNILKESVKKRNAFIDC